MGRLLRLSIGVLATATAASFAPIASATRWNSGFDPIGAITFSGNGLFQFDDGCLGANGSLGATYCHLQLIGGSVDMQDNGPGGSAAHLDFGSQVIGGPPRNPVQPGAVFTIVLNETSPDPSNRYSATITLGASQGSGLFAVSDLKVVASTTGVPSFFNVDFSNLFFDSNNFQLSGYETAQFLGGGGGTHNLKLTFFDPQGTWQTDDTNPLNQTQTSIGTYETVVSFNVQGGALTGLNSGLIGPAFVSDSGSTLFGPWWIEWQAGVVDPVFLYGGQCDGEFCQPNGDFTGEAVHITFTEISGPGIPEPGTLGLLLGGFGAAWLAFRPPLRRRLSSAARRHTRVNDAMDDADTACVTCLRSPRQER